MLKKWLMLVTILFAFNYLSCDFYGDEEEFRRKIIVETNLSFLESNYFHLDSNTVYPHTVYEESGPLSSSYYMKFTIYATQDTGMIRFSIYGGDGYSQKYYFKDSMTVYAPLSNTLIEIDKHHFIRN
jgi:hypothetical protein